ncbi:MAG: hypothetical protein AAGG44_18865 [Planctomycetota bacterium]
MQTSVTNRKAGTKAIAPKSGVVRIGPRNMTQEKKADIHVHKVDDRIESIVVTCACGEKITIVCEYPTETPS